MQENAGCGGGAGLRISEALSLEDCGYQCSKTWGRTVFRVGRSDGSFCRGQDRCRCVCPMKAHRDNCVTITTKGMDLYKINPKAGDSNVSFQTHRRLLSCCRLP